MQYLLDELNAHENDHSDALALEQPPAGEAALAQPAMTETAHDAVLVADVRVLQSDREQNQHIHGQGQRVADGDVG